MEINPATWIALATFAGTAIYIALTGRRPNSSPSPVLLESATIKAPEPSELDTLESAARQAAIRRQEQALRQHHLGQIASEMGLTVGPDPDGEAPPKPTPKPAPKK